MIATVDSWPDSIDSSMIAFYAALAVGLPALGYLILAIDIRKHYLKVRRALVIISTYTRELPAWLTKRKWAQHQLPPCLQTLGLDMPFTEEQLLAAYRERVKHLHPDRGGDRDEFLQLQKHFEEARSLLAEKC